mmetsp:Transcript_77346/g.169185  ORF Transcript_77346/g.169185 Transcript_77346/m.169185 type:complete len:218 (-) Transcript_77346:334-987(-)
MSLILDSDLPRCLQQPREKLLLLQHRLRDRQQYQEVHPHRLRFRPSWFQEDADPPCLKPRQVTMKTWLQGRLTPKRKSKPTIRSVNTRRRRRRGRRSYVGAGIQARFSEGKRLRRLHLLHLLGCVPSAHGAHRHTRSRSLAHHRLPALAIRKPTSHTSRSCRRRDTGTSSGAARVAGDLVPRMSQCVGSDGDLLASAWLGCCGPASGRQLGLQWSWT